MRIIISVIFTVMLTGCVGDQANKQESGPPTITINTPPVAPAEVSKADMEKLHNETIASTNQSQQAITGLGANIAKVAEKMTGVEGDVSAVKAAINTNIQTTADIKNSLTASASVVAQLKNEMKAEFDAKLTAQAEFHANAVAALKSQIENTSTTISAGRDATTTQFTKEMMQTLETSYKSMVSEIKTAFYAVIAIVHIFAGVLVAFMRGAVKHAREDSQEWALIFKSQAKEKANGGNVA